MINAREVVSAIDRNRAVELEMRRVKAQARLNQAKSEPVGSNLDDFDEDLEDEDDEGDEGELFDEDDDTLIEELSRSPGAVKRTEGSAPQ